jgi:hypothetical protein
MKIKTSLKKTSNSCAVLMAASTVDRLAGFCGVWIVYAAASGLAWPALKRISPGFCRVKCEEGTGGRGC